MIKNPIVDKTKEYIDNTIDNLIDKDVYSIIYPIFGDKVDMSYFKAYQISVVDEGLTDKELKTISYLAPFIKEKIKYNVKEIVRYLRFIGYTDTTYEDVFTIVLNKNIKNMIKYSCFQLEEQIKLGIYNIDNVLTFDDYLRYKQKKFYYTNSLKAEIGINYIDGISKNYSISKVK